MEQNNSIWFTEKELTQVLELIKTGSFCGYWKSPNGGKYLQEFEDKFASFNGVKHSVAVTNGSTSILCGLLGCGVLKGDLVAVSPYTHIGSVAPILMAGASPIFVDVDPNTGNIDPYDLKEKSRQKKLKAVVVPHQLGRPSDMEAVLDSIPQGVKVIEDASQALGASINSRKIGSFGDVGCFSIGGDMTKTITAGEGGMIVTNNEEIAEKCRDLRNHGDAGGKKYLCFNYRLPELNALIGLIQMNRIEFQNGWQINNAKYLIQNLPEYLEFIPPQNNTKSTYYIIGTQYKSKKQKREVFLDRLFKIGFEGGRPRKNVGKGYSKLIYHIPLYNKYASNCRNAEKLIKNSVWIDWHRYPIEQPIIDDLLSAIRRVE